jgi:hypothetical protein
MLDKVKSFIVAKPLLAVGLALAIGGVLALAFPAVRRLLNPVAKKVPGSSAA